MSSVDVTVDDRRAIIVNSVWSFRVIVEIIRRCNK